MNNRHIYVLSAVLALIGLALFAYKSQVLGFPLQPQEQTRVWTVEAAVRFDPGPAAVKATLRIPNLTPGFSILDENFISRGFGHATRSAPAGRESQWTLRRGDRPADAVLPRAGVSRRQPYGRGHDAAVSRTAGARRAVAYRHGRIDRRSAAAVGGRGELHDRAASSHQSRRARSVRQPVHEPGQRAMRMRRSWRPSSLPAPRSRLVSRTVFNCAT